MDDPPIDISNFSKIFALLDKIPYFIIQTILIKICIFKYYFTSIVIKDFLRSSLPNNSKSIMSSLRDIYKLSTMLEY